MSYNQWKILNTLRDTVSKINSDKSMQSKFSKDFWQIIQKLPPTLNTNNAIKYFGSTSDGEKKPVVVRKTDDSYLPSVITDLKNKIALKKEPVKKEVIPKWKQNAGVLESCISSRTDQILQSIQLTTLDNLNVNFIEQLLNHVKKYPQVKNRAVKLGAIRLLLKVRARTQNELVLQTTREALALLGHTDPVPRRGIRILSIDGGGIRGLLVLEMLKKLEELTGKRVYELFDFMCGVSTGAILSFSIGVHHRTLDEISKGYEAISREVFKQSSWRGTGSLVWSHSYYDTSLWERKLKESLGTNTLISTARNPNCPKLCAISAVVNQARLSAFVFRNYSLPWKFQSQYCGSCDCEIWQAARASAAAPTYFEEFKLGNLLHQDGGIFVNNPTAIALHEAKLLWPDTPIQCVVSFGTGRTVPSKLDLAKMPECPNSVTNTSSWTNKFFTILDSATDTEAVHTMLNDLLPGNVYYRFNPYLTEMVSMVETEPKKLEQMKRDAIMYLRRNEDKFQEAAKVLLEKKTPKQAAKDFIRRQREILGL